MGSPGQGTRSPGLPIGVSACLALLLLSGACATLRDIATPSRSADVIVLLPDDRGKTGAISVSTGGGSELLLSKPREAVTVTKSAGAGTPRVLKEDEVRSMVGPALASLPPRPETYIFHFVHDTAILTPESLAGIRSLTEEIGLRKPVEISIVGHTDTMGTREYNQRLGQKRARKVAALLVDAGIAPSILEISSHGEGNPLVPTGDEVPEPRNRRVELTVR